MPHLGDEIAGSQLDNGGETSHGSRRVTLTEPVMRTNMPGATSPVTKSGSPVSMTSDLTEATQAVDVRGPNFGNICSSRGSMAAMGNLAFHSMR